jgi:hypothetical protein
VDKPLFAGIFPDVSTRPAGLFQLGAVALIAGGVWAAGPGLPTSQQSPNPLRQNPRNPFLVVCEPLRTGSQAFPDVFQRAVRLFARPSEMFNVVICWLECGGRATLGGREDLAKHFLFAGALEAEFNRGDQTSVLKEMTDPVHDFDDLAAGMAGTEWMRRAYRDKDWLRQWATGQKSLTNNLPAFHYGTHAKTNAILDVITRDIEAAFAR